MKFAVGSLLDIRKKVNKYIVFVLSLIMVFLIGYFDWITKHYIILAIFYLIPISLSVIFLGRNYGVILSLIASIIWCFMDISFDSDYTNVFFPIINNIMRFGYFLIHTYLLSTIIDLLVKAEELSLIDPLTGISNLRGFYIFMNYELNKAKREQKPLTVLLFDLDNFKDVNDVYGHSVGDRLLKVVCDIVKSNLRSTDIFARLGGDEFSIIFPQTDINESVSIVQRFREKVIEAMKVNKWPVTLSIGIVTFNRLDLSIDEMLHKVDEVMYRVKKSSKDGIVQEEYP